MLEAIIFDMDGVLIDSESKHYPVLKQLLAEHGYDYTPVSYTHLTLPTN